MEVGGGMEFAKIDRLFFHHSTFCHHRAGKFFRCWSGQNFTRKKQKMVGTMSIHSPTHPNFIQNGGRFLKLISENIFDAIILEFVFGKMKTVVTSIFY